MALSLTASALLEKNKLSSDGAFIILLQITIPAGMYDNATEQVIRVCRNLENIEWNGETWVAWPFELNEVSESAKGEVPRVQLKLSNISKVIQRHVENAGGGVGSSVSLFVVHSKHLDGPSMLPEMVFQTVSCVCTPTWVTFNLGSDNPYSKRFPLNRFIALHCRFQFKDKKCKYSGNQTSCDYSYSTCKTVMHNIANFGGFPSMMIGGVYAT